MQIYKNLQNLELVKPYLHLNKTILLSKHNALVELNLLYKIFYEELTQRDKDTMNDVHTVL